MRMTAKTVQCADSRYPARSPEPRPRLPSPSPSPVCGRGDGLRPLFAGFANVAFEDEGDLVGGDFGVDVGVDYHDRGQAAGAEAAGGFEGEHAVGAGLAEGDA